MTRNIHPTIRIYLLFVLLILFSACSSQRKSARTQTGIASWYGPGFHGKKTANGERYNQRRMTAAHKTLPFNTVVKVKNLDNGRSVKVRINDRGPYVDDRIIDLSKKAAKKLGLMQSGTARVKIIIPRQAVSQGNTNVSRGKESFGVQVASYNSQKEAEKKARSINDAYVISAKVSGKNVYRVFVGKYANRNDATKKKDELKSKGIDGFVKQLQN